MIDFEALNDELCKNSLGLLEDWIPGGTVENGEYKVTNPTRADNQPGSFAINLNNGKWIDFATGDKGKDLISVYAYIHNIGQGDAAKDLNGGNFRDLPIREKPVNKPKPKLRQIFNVPESAWGSAPKHFPKKENGKWVEYPFTKKWPYHTPDGLVFGYIGKIESPEFGKETIPVGYFQESDSTRAVWKYKSFNAPRILYASHLLKSRPDGQLFLVEGEKCAQALQKELGQSGIATTWAGGSKAVGLSDFTQLRGRSVIIWPDWDRPGIEAANKLLKILTEIEAARVAVIDLTLLKRKPKKGWDVADLIEKDKSKLWGFIKKYLVKDFTGFQVDQIFPQNENKSTTPQNPQKKN